MIRRLRIRGVATYRDVEFNDFRTSNYVYGSNGAGKTTLSRVLKTPSGLGQSSVESDPDTTVLVYNREFVKENFYADANLPGVFTLGEEDVTARQAIQASQESLAKDQRDLAYAELEIQRAEEEITTISTTWKGTFWKQKASLPDSFQFALKGHLKSQEAFLTALLEWQRTEQGEVRSLEDLVLDANNLGGDLQVGPVLTSFDISNYLDWETKVKQLLELYSESDLSSEKEKARTAWKSAGLDFLAESAGVCPMCAQAISKSLRDKIEKSVRANVHVLTEEAKLVLGQYRQSTEPIIKYIDGLTASEGLMAMAPPVNFANLVHLLRQNVEICLAVGKTPIIGEFIEVGIELKSVEVWVEAHRRNAIAKNRLIEQGKAARENLIHDIRRYVVAKCSDSLEAYRSALVPCEKRRDGFNAKVKGLKNSISELKRKIDKEERRLSEVRPTLDSINRTLASFGFTAFQLEVAPSGKEYRIVRPDGREVGDSLSEGERTFLTILYFLNLCKGSQSGTGVSARRVVVFDDPVSSLDSEVLFIVSSLIKEVMTKAESGEGVVEQVFVLTHNIFFLKEVSYRHNRSSTELMSCESFWRLIKSKGETSCISWSRVPTLTSYEMLWETIRHGRPDHDYRNAMRRILETHFRNVLRGGFNAIDGLMKDPGNREQWLALKAWLHDGSRLTCNGSSRFSGRCSK